MSTLAPSAPCTLMTLPREQMIMQYAPLVRHAVGSLRMTARPGLDAEDIYSYGTMGLIDAIDRFDASRGVKFETYALPRIRGYLLDQLRAMDWLPRTARARVRAVQRTSAQMEARLGRRPDRDELAEETGLAATLCDQALADGTCQTISLESLTVLDDDGSPLSLLQQLEDEQSPNPALTSEQRELRLGVLAALDQLPEREREILRLRYIRNWTLRQVATHLDVSESRASQLHNQALVRMRRLLLGMFGDLASEARSA